MVPGAYIKRHNYLRFHNVSAASCADSCTLYESEVYAARCLSFDYNVADKLCYLNARNQLTILHEEDWKLDDAFVHYERGKIVMRYD